MPRWKTSCPVTCDEVLPGLVCFSTSWVVDGAEKRLHSYYLPEPGVLVDGPDRVSFYKDHASVFGAGIRYHLLTHGADASAACIYVEKAFGAAPYIHRDDAEYASRKVGATIEGSFSEPHEIFPGMAAIPLPGHTAGFTVYLWTGSSGRRLLFCGDIVYRDKKGWTAFLNDGLHQVGAQSLQQLGAIDCDALLPNETWSEPTPPVPFREERADLVAAVLARVKSKYKVVPA